ncbi:MAG: molybdenum cofactor guanylyltransferase [Aigarchaeota archaeon]|nr:molybdenum cofactor guanylyltransferase [Aigarchaeota archaeon]
MERAAVILAGGRSERFQRTGEPWVDKALTVVNGKTILERMVVQLRSCVDEIAISVSSEESKRSYFQALPSRIAKDIRIVIDDVGSAGPLAGIATSIKHIDAKQLLVLPCDIPFLNPAVVTAIFERIRASDAAVPVWPNGVLEPLMAVYKGSRIRSCCPMLSSAGRRRPSDLIRASGQVTFVSIENDLMVLDPEHRSFFSINYRDDVGRTMSAPLPEGSVNATFAVPVSLVQDRDLLTVSNAVEAITRPEDRSIDRVIDYLRKVNGYFWAAFLAEAAAKSLSVLRRSLQEDQMKLFEDAAHAYRLEARLHLKHGLLPLSAHALLDEAWCWRKTCKEDRSRYALRAAASIYARLGLDARKSKALST